MQADSKSGPSNVLIRIDLSFNIQEVKCWLLSCKSIFYTEVYNITVTTGGWLSCMIVISSMYLISK